MIIPRHKVCDVCGHDLVNKKYYTIKSKTLGYDMKKHHICDKCANEFVTWLSKQESIMNR